MNLKVSKKQCPHLCALLERGIGFGFGYLTRLVFYRIQLSICFESCIGFGFVMDFERRRFSICNWCKIDNNRLQNLCTTWVIRLLSLDLGSRLSMKTSRVQAPKYSRYVVSIKLNRYLVCKSDLSNLRKFVPKLDTYFNPRT